MRLAIRAELTMARDVAHEEVEKFVALREDNTEVAANGMRRAEVGVKARSHAK